MILRRPTGNLSVTFQPYTDDLLATFRRLSHNNPVIFRRLSDGNPAVYGNHRRLLSSHPVTILPLQKLIAIFLPEDTKLF